MITVALVVVSVIIVVYLLDICGIQGTVKDHFKDASTVSEYSPLVGEYRSTWIENKERVYIHYKKVNGMTAFSRMNGKIALLDTKAFEEGKPVILRNDIDGSGMRAYIKYVASETSLYFGEDDKKGGIVWFLGMADVYKFERK